MLPCLLFAAAATPLRILESYEVNDLLQRAKDSHEVYLLVLFKPPTHPNLTSAAFARFIDAIPLPLDPVLGIVVDPTSAHNQLIYAHRDGTSTRINFPYHHIFKEYVESLSRGVSHEVQLRLRAILATVLRSSPRAKAEQTEADRRVERFRAEYASAGVQGNMTGAVEALIALKNLERAGLIKQAIAVQKALDEEVPPGRRAPLPAFADVDPARGEYDAAVAGTGEDADEGARAQAYDEIADDDAPPSLVNTVPEGDDGEEEGAERTEDDIEEDRKRAGPIRNVIDAVWARVRALVGRGKEEDEEETPKRKRKAEEEEKPKKKKKVEEDDETPKRKKKAEAEEEEKPKRKREEEKEEELPKRKSQAEAEEEREKKRRRLDAEKDENPNAKPANLHPPRFTRETGEAQRQSAEGASAKPDADAAPPVVRAPERQSEGSDADTAQRPVVRAPDEAPAPRPAVRVAEQAPAPPERPAETSDAGAGAAQRAHEEVPAPAERRTEGSDAGAGQRAREDAPAPPEGPAETSDAGAGAAQRAHEDAPAPPERRAEGSDAGTAQRRGEASDGHRGARPALHREPRAPPAPDAPAPDRDRARVVGDRLPPRQRAFRDRLMDGLSRAREEHAKHEAPADT